MAQAFDAASLQLSGSELPVAHGLATGDPVINPADYSAGPDGLLVLATGGRPNKLVWRDRSGKVIDELASGDDLGTPRISPDGRRVAFVRVDRENMDIYVADSVQPSELRRLTFDPAIDRYPIWSPDGATITFFGRGPKLRSLSQGFGWDGRHRTAHVGAVGATRDGLVGRREASCVYPEHRGDRLDDPPRRRAAVHVSSDERQRSAQSIQSNDAVAARVFVGRDRRTPRDLRHGLRSGKTGGRRSRWQISTAGAHDAHAGGATAASYYWALDGTLMAAKVDNSGLAFRYSTPTPLFRVQPPTLRTNDINFDVTRERPAVSDSRARGARENRSR